MWQEELAVEPMDLALALKLVKDTIMFICLASTNFVTASADQDEEFSEDVANEIYESSQQEVMLFKTEVSIVANHIE